MDWALTGGSWIVIAFTNAAVASALGRSRLNWFIISFFLGPIGSLLLALFGRSEAYELAHQRAQQALVDLSRPPAP